MKKTIITISAAAVMAVAVACIFCTIKANENPFLNANVEALSEYEIIVGPLCMVAKNSACTSLGVVYEEHYKAD